MKALSVLALLALTVASCLAQSAAGGGTILGTVKDSTGAAIPSAKVTILHTGTGRQLKTASNQDGYFVTPTLASGDYRIHVEAAGMKSWQEQLLLETGTTVEVAPVLSPGSINELVMVTATIPLVSTTDPTDASTLDSQRIKELPINGRDLNTLLGQVAPGVEQIIDVNGGVRTGGLMVYSNSFVQDGAPSNNREFGGSMNLQGLESVGEVRVETSTSSVRYNAPTTVIVGTKSGTNRLRLSVYETARNNAFGVARARQDISFNPNSPYHTPKLIRNEFGGSAGGPIIIPKLYNGKNRTFFFFSREGVELRQGITKDFAVPTAAMRGGDFSQLYDSAGRFITLYDPATTRIVAVGNRKIAVRDPFLNNRIPLSRMGPLAKYIWGITPLPSDVTNPVTTTNLKVAVPTNGNPKLSDNPTTIKIDHRISERDNFFIKTNGGRRFTNFQGTGTGTGAPTANGEANMTFLPMQAISLVASWTHMFKPNLFVETTASETWQSTKTVTGPTGAQANFASQLGLPNPYGEIGFPNITALGNFMTYTEGDNRRALTSRILSVQQNYNYIVNTHNFQFGWTLMRETQHLLPDQGAISGSAAFSSLATALESPTLGSDTNPQAVPQTGYDAANFFLGIAGTYTVGQKRSYLRLHDKTVGLYLGDTYKVTAHLTITPGVRWDINPAMFEENYQLNGFDRASHSVVLPQPLDYYYGIGSTTPQVVKVFQDTGMSFKSAAELGLPQNVFPNNYFDIAPRLGFAWTTGKERPFVIRGGYGMYISAIPMRTLLAQFSGVAPFRATFTYNPNAAATSPTGINNYLLTTVPTYTAGVNTTGVISLNSPNPVGRGSSGVIGIDPNFPDLKIHEWNLAIEKQVSRAMVVRIRYNGKHGVNADQLNEINPQPTTYVYYLETGKPTVTGTFGSVYNRPYDNQNYGSVRYLSKTGMINTQSLVLETERRFSNGLGFQAFYTLTNANRLAGNSFRDGVGTVPEQYLPGAVPSDPEARNKFLNYTRDSAIPQHRVRWNFSYDVPFGKRGRYLKGGGKIVDGVIGGWKLAGSGTVVSSWYTMPTGNWGAVNKFEVYGTKYPILDCRATSPTATSKADERCYQGYLFYNGYISNRFINSVNAAGLRNGVYGLPSDYKPLQSPINPWPVNGQTTDANSALYDTNNVNLKLQNGSTVLVGVDTGLHPFRNQFALGPFNWSQDASMLKFFNLTEHARLRINVDVFNVLNRQGLNTPGSDGVVTLQNSYGGFGFRPRQVQLGARLEW